MILSFFNYNEINNKLVKKDYIYSCFNNLNLNDTTNSCSLSNIKFKVKNEIFSLDNYTTNDISSIQKDIISAGSLVRKKTMLFAYNNGFTKEESLLYAYPELKNFISYIENKFCFKPKNACLKAIKNTGKIYISEEEEGVELNKISLFNDLFDKINGFSNVNIINLHFFKTESDIKKEYYEDKIKLRGSYYTNFSSSLEPRKNNIKKAMQSLDGTVIMPGDIISFNKTTGERNEVNGYMKAKTIKNGSYFEEYGGGVCQVSSTFYNTALLSDLEIIEVHPHSLPVSYVEPCFDAMVSIGSSDLVVKNNTEAPIIIACSTKNDICLINIYGLKNDFVIKRVSKKLDTLEDFERIVTYDYKSVGLDTPINEGESKVISYGKPGYKATGMLEYYKDEILIKTKQIRTDTYRPTKEVILKA